MHVAIPSCVPTNSNNLRPLDRSDLANTPEGTAFTVLRGAIVA